MDRLGRILRSQNGKMVIFLFINFFTLNSDLISTLIVGDFRLFCGDLGNDVTDELLTRIFSRYPSFTKARVVRDRRTNKTKGFGFISFKDPQDFIKASKEMNGENFSLSFSAFDEF